MKDFILLFRNDLNAQTERTSEEAKAMTQRWMDWVAGIAAKGQLTDRGNRLAYSGRVVREKNIVTNGPYSEIKESIAGYSIVKAESYEAAAALAESCPVFLTGGNVEIREISLL